jgi:hypothetical protein
MDWQYWQITNYTLALISYSSVILITLLGITPLGQRLAQLFLSVRDVMPHEVEQFTPILHEAQQIVKNKIPKYKNKQSIKLMIGNNNLNNMQAFGTNTIIISNMLLTTASPQ